MENNLRNILFGALPESDSPAGTVNATDWRKTIRHSFVVIAGIAATAGLDQLNVVLTNNDFGKWQLIVSMVVSSGLLELGRRWIADHTNINS